jgi:hypothetical protein
MKMTAEESVLRRLWASTSHDSCSRMLRHGWFLRIRKQDKYDVSIAIGELELMPAVGQGSADWLIIADGFSCREQIAQERSSPRCSSKLCNLAEVLQMATQRQPPPQSPSLPRTKRCKAQSWC